VRACVCDGAYKVDVILMQFFAQKFYGDEIMVLPQKWQKVIKQNGTYLVY